MYLMKGEVSDTLDVFTMCNETFYRSYMFK